MQKKPTPDGKCYGYCRVSTDKQMDHGSSIRAQVDQITRYAEWRGLDLGAKVQVNLGDGAPFESRERIIIEADSAYKKDLFERQGGKALKGLLLSGDMIVFAKLDRGFRNVMDLRRTLAWAKKSVVSIVFLDLQIDTGSPIGEMLLTIIGAVAEMESARRSERVSDAYRARSVENPVALSRFPFHGFLVVNTHKGRQLEPSLKERIRHLPAYYEWLRRKCQQDGRIIECWMNMQNPRIRRGDGKRYHLSWVNEMMLIETEMREIENELHDRGAPIHYPEVCEIWISRYTSRLASGEIQSRRVFHRKIFENRAEVSKWAFSVNQKHSTWAQPPFIPTPDAGPSDVRRRRSVRTTR